jgi:hypothetical protein
LSDNELKEHARADHRNWFPANEKALEDFLESFAVESAQKKYTDTFYPPFSCFLRKLILL